ncbi:XerC Integrase [Candidatus Pelagibacterales bacterium]|jgi:integrase
MVIRKHGNKWQCIVRLKGISVTQSFISKADARKWGNKQEAQIRLGTYSDDSKLTNLRLRDLLKLYFDKAVKVSRRPKLLKYEVDLLCRLPISSNTFNTLTAVKLANFRDERLKAGKSTTTVGKYLKLISRAIIIGQRELGISIANNPVDLVEKPRPNPPRDIMLNKTELQNLFNACNGQLRNIVEVAYYTLCRRSEILRLNYSDVDWITSTAIIRETKNGTDRRIGLAPRVIEILKSLPRSISGNFFNIISISSFEKSFRSAVKRSGIKDFRFHDLRHCGATYLVESGWSTMELMQQGGWSSQQMAKRYSNISPTHLANKMKKMNFI